jgi:hypothetical protein
VKQITTDALNDKGAFTTPKTHPKGIKKVTIESTIQTSELSIRTPSIYHKILAVPSENAIRDRKSMTVMVNNPSQ